jgi:hypothetical protein
MTAAPKRKVTSAVPARFIRMATAMRMGRAGRRPTGAKTQAKVSRPAVSVATPSVSRWRASRFFTVVCNRSSRRRRAASRLRKDGTGRCVAPGVVVPDNWVPADPRLVPPELDPVNVPHEPAPVVLDEV